MASEGLLSVDNLNITPPQPGTTDPNWHACAFLTYDEPVEIPEAPRWR